MINNSKIHSIIIIIIIVYPFVVAFNPVAVISYVINSFCSITVAMENQYKHVNIKLRFMF